MYQLEERHSSYGMYYAITRLGKIVHTYDEGELEEALIDLQKLNGKKKYEVRFLISKSRWITKEGRHLQVAVEEPTRKTITLIASSEQEAINLTKNSYKDYIINDVVLKAV